MEEKKLQNSALDALANDSKQKTQEKNTIDLHFAMHLHSLVLMFIVARFVSGIIQTLTFNVQTKPTIYKRETS